MTTQFNTDVAVRKRREVHAARALLVAVLLLPGAAALADVAWPTVTIPHGIEAVDTGGELLANGMPLRMRGILSPKTPAQVAALFRDSLGQPLVENTLGARLVLGRALGEFYATVELEPFRAGTRGVVAVTRLSAAGGQRGAARQAEQRILSRFPSGSRLVSRTNSTAGQRHAEYLAVRNSLGTEFNVEHLKRMFDAEGYTLERGAAPPRLAHPASTRPSHGTTLFFKRRDAEVVAVIYRDHGGDTDIVLNTVTAPEQVK